MNLFIRVVESKAFRITTMIIGLLFTISSIFFDINPSTFLQTGYLGVFIFSFFSSGMFLVPVVINHMPFIPFAVISSLAMTLNESISWYVGNVGTDILPHGEKTKNLMKIIKKYGLFAVFFFALIPFPFDTIGILAGYLGIPYIPFIITTFVARVLRIGLIWIGIFGLTK